jgi:ABC-type multidrug transport system ATPase subunit
MQMLTAEFPASDGDAVIAGHSVMHSPEKTRSIIGYCPQFDAHFPNLTGREHVELYARIKGIPKSKLEFAISRKLEQVGLSLVDSGRLASDYSGGMKRRLSLACALVGQPRILFLGKK